MRCLIIADDFTGAAECAGLGHRVGIRASIYGNKLPLPAPGMTVINTASRSMAPEAASRHLDALLEGLDSAPYDLI